MALTNPSFSPIENGLVINQPSVADDASFQEWMDTYFYCEAVVALTGSISRPALRLGSCGEFKAAFRMAAVNEHLA